MSVEQSQGSAKQENKKQETYDLTAGFAVFASMAYIAFAVPLILAEAKFPIMPVFFATCAAACLGSLLVGFYAGYPNAIAPGVALSVTISQYCVAQSMHWTSALVICFVAGILFMVASFFPIRRWIVDAIPKTIKLALAGGIGALLAEKALEVVVDKHVSIDAAKMTLFVIGLACVFLGYTVCRGLAQRYEGRLAGRLLNLAGGASFFVSVGAVISIAFWKYPDIQDLWKFAATDKRDPLSDAWTIWQGASLSWETIWATIEEASKNWLLLFFIAYIFFADILGSPYYMELEKENKFDPAEIREKTPAIRKSFYVDSFLNVLAAIGGTSPPVYYAENHSAEIIGGRGPNVAYVVAGCFLVFLIVGAGFKFYDAPLLNFVPKISVAPVLFFVGLLIIAKSLAHHAADHDDDPTLPELSREQKMLRHLPAAVTIVATPVTTFDIAISCGILSYLTFWIFLPAKRRDKEVKQPVAFCLLAAVAAFDLYHRLAAVAPAFKFF